MISNKRFFLLIGLIAIVYFIGLFCPLIEYDSNQFAVMAMRMYQENDFVSLIKGTNEYLDKPHMHFWLSAFSFELFGLSNWAYRLPSILLTFFAAYSCYGLGKLLYNRNVGIIAALMFLTAQTIILANIDVRTDAVLTAFSIFSIWQLALYVEKQKLIHIVLGAMAAGFAFSTKGQIALVVIGLSLVCHLLYTRSWGVVWSWKVLVGLLTFGVSIIPMLYAYYIQFDLHPEIIIRGKGERTGLFFIFWEQSFERLQGIGHGKTGDDYFFFFHTLLWEFIPWTLIMIGAFYFRIKEFIAIKFSKKEGFEFLTIGSLLVILFIISFSKFKLPHYLNILIPLVAVLTASFLYRLKDNNRSLNIVLKFQYFTVSILIIIASLLLFYVFGIAAWYVVVLAIAVFILLIYFILLKENKLSKIITISVIAAVFVNIVMNAHFYPKLLDYQAGYNIALKTKELKIDEKDIYKLLDDYSWALDFGSQKPIPKVSLEDLKQKDLTNDVWVYVNEEGLKQLENAQFNTRDYIKSPQFRITQLSKDFLNPNTREEILSYNYLVNIKKN